MAGPKIKDDPVHKIGRRILAYSRFAVCLASIGSFVFIRTIEMQMIAVFFAIAGLLHAWLAVENPSKRTVRCTDYLYFGLVTIGVVIAAMAARSEREALYLSSRDMASISLRPLHGAFVSAIALCDVPLAPEPLFPLAPRFLWFQTKLHPEFCTWLKSNVEAIRNGTPGSNYQIFKDADPEMANLHNRPMIPLSSAERSAIQSVRLYHDLRDIAARDYIFSPEFKVPEPSVEENWLRLQMQSVWPLLLLIGLAIRITRVTADVLDWNK
jgi:hypothetical protein